MGYESSVAGNGWGVFAQTNFKRRTKMEKQDYITLKWGTLKSWKITSEEGVGLIDRYNEIESSISAMCQQDTGEQKKLICEMIDTVPGEIYLDWDGEYVSKDKAKAYVMEYGKKAE